MFLVDSKHRNTIILTASRYTSSRNVFHDTIQIHFIPEQWSRLWLDHRLEKWTINRLCNLEAIPNTSGNDLISCGNDLLTCGNDLLSCGNDLLTCGNDFLTCGNDLLSCGTR